MKIEIDHDICIGCGICEITCPEVFKMKDDVMSIIKNPTLKTSEKACMEAKEDCPVEAISIKE